MQHIVIQIKRLIHQDGYLIDYIMWTIPVSLELFSKSIFKFSYAILDDHKAKILYSIYK